MASVLPGPVKAALKAAKALGVTTAGVLKRETAGDYDPITESYTSSVVSDSFDMAPADIGANELSSDTVQIGDRRYIIEGAKLVNTVTPHKDDLLEIEGEDWALVYFDDYGKKAAFMLHVRKVQ
ncbi:MAG: hypothetical protein ACSHWQ_00025 [Spongiibacteraceae bacterium]